jgi:hypothetical protein
MSTKRALTNFVAAPAAVCFFLLILLLPQNQIARLLFLFFPFVSFVLSFFHSLFISLINEQDVIILVYFGLLWVFSRPN